MFYVLYVFNVYLYCILYIYIYIYFILYRKKETPLLRDGILHICKLHYCLKMGLIQVKQKLTWIKHHFMFMYVDVYYTKSIH